MLFSHAKIEIHVLYNVDPENRVDKKVTQSPINEPIAVSLMWRPRASTALTIITVITTISVIVINVATRWSVKHDAVHFWYPSIFSKS